MERLETDKCPPGLTIPEKFLECGQRSPQVLKNRNTKNDVQAFGCTICGRDSGKAPSIAVTFELALRSSARAESTRTARPSAGKNIADECRGAIAAPEITQKLAFDGPRILSNLSRR